MYVVSIYLVEIALYRLLPGIKENPISRIPVIIPVAKTLSPKGHVPRPILDVVLLCFKKHGIL